VFDFGTSSLENATISLTFSLTHAKSGIYNVSMPRIKDSKGVLLRQASRTPYLIFKTMLAANKNHNSPNFEDLILGIFASFFILEN
jgi:hypothetical protein